MPSKTNSLDQAFIVSNTNPTSQQPWPSIHQISYQDSQQIAYKFDEQYQIIEEQDLSSTIQDVPDPSQE